MGMARVSGGAWDVFFPPQCAACAEVLDGPPSAFCDACELGVLPLPSPRCPTCAEPTQNGESCERCRRTRSPVDSAFAPFVHDGPLARAIHRFKYEDHPEL